MVSMRMTAAPLPCLSLRGATLSIVTPMEHPDAIAFASIASVTEDLYTHTHTHRERERERIEP